MVKIVMAPTCQKQVILARTHSLRPLVNQKTSFKLLSTLYLDKDEPMGKLHLFQLNKLLVMGTDKSWAEHDKPYGTKKYVQIDPKTLIA